MMMMMRRKKEKKIRQEGPSDCVSSVRKLSHCYTILA